MFTVARGVVFFSILLAVSGFCQYAAAANVWLPLLSAQLGSVQLDKNCPNNVIKGLSLDKSGVHINATIERLDWSLDCQRATQTPQKSSQAKGENAAWLTRLHEIKNVPDFTLNIKKIKLQSAYLHDDMTLSAVLSKRASRLNATLSSDFLNVSVLVDIKRDQLTIDAIFTLASLSPYIHFDMLPFSPLSESPIIARGLTAQALSINKVRKNKANKRKSQVKFHYQSKPNNLQQGLFKLTGTGYIANVLEALTLTLNGEVDLAQQKMTIAHFLLRAKEVAISLKGAANKTWKTAQLSLQNTSVIEINAAPFKIQNLGLRFDVAGQAVYSSDKSNKSKLSMQKIAPVSLQVQASQRKSEWLVGWTLSSLAQHIQGKLTLDEQHLTLTVLKEQIELSTFFAALGRYEPGLAGIKVNAGKLNVDVFAQYNSKQASWQFESAINSDEISGNQDDVRFSGLKINSHFHYIVDAQHKATIHKDKQQLEIEQLFVGFPISAVKVAGRLLFEGAPIVDSFHAYLLGGHANFEHLKVTLPSQTIIHLNAISLADIVKYGSYPSVRVAGVIDATLPIAVSDAGLDIVNGSMKARAPGGYIKVPEYLVAQTLGESNPVFNIVQQVLSDFKFDIMQGAIGYTHDGKGTLKLNINGKGPTVQGTQQINFVYSHSENIIKLLQSLRFNEQLQQNMKERY